MELTSIYLGLFAGHVIFAFIACIFVSASIFLSSSQKMLLTMLTIGVPIIGACLAIDKANDITNIKRPRNVGGLNFDEDKRSSEYNASNDDSSV
ncbi:hypothetical protein CWB96_15470 [Pseudoalteromonas citrea]|uniref:Uncharacterized protein n=1 Tax=Pseudoalteromonas citrea TaxID=43655 RepID=A0A5S3XLC0_9GAMM|nr:hypothetical protein [Pseudoalteromonas citrea]TMP41137.1 hypothetical protein CWB97_15810 [Pseudoalteromonas citrea]TMP56242.1 hypothetical protein CWB96_15470 [Pseudoalteromonas citrea]